MKQLSLFTPQFSSKIRRVELDGKTYFSILDVLQYQGSEGSASNPAVYWQRAKKRLADQAGDVITGVLEHQFEGQGQRKTPVGTVKFFMRLAQAVEIQEWEYLRDWMADLAVERIEEEANPELGMTRAEKRYIASQTKRGMSPQEAETMLETRRQSADTFKQLMDAVKAVCTDTPQYGRIVGIEYDALFQQTTEGLKTILKTKSIRDELPELQLQYLRTAESGLRAILLQKSRMNNDAILQATRTVCYPLGKHLQEICGMLGIDLVTGTPLLQDKTQ